MRICAILLFILTLVSDARADIDNVSVIGQWITTSPSWTAGNLRVFDAYDIRSDSTVVASSVCYYGSKKIEAVAPSVPLDVTYAQIIFQGDERATENDGNDSCTVRIKRETWNYQINGNRLRLISGPHSTSFRRR